MELAIETRMESVFPFSRCNTVCLERACTGNYVSLYFLNMVCISNRHHQSGAWVHVVVVT